MQAPGNGRTPATGRSPWRSFWRSWGWAVLVLALAVALVAVDVLQPGQGPSKAFVPPGHPVPPPRVIPTASPGTVLSANLAPLGGALFGALVFSPRGESREPELEQLESELGRTLDIDREYYAWDDPIPTEQETLDVTRGRITLVSWKAVTHAGEPVPWARIASGAEDGWIATRADAFRSFGHPVMLVFHHEPENDVKTNGTPMEFVAAWRHVHEIFVREGATNVVWVVTLFAISYGGAGVSRFYPGDDVVDWVGADGYNFFGTFAGHGGCRRPAWRSFSDVFSGVVTFAEAHGKPVMIAEWGTPEDPAVPGRKAEWFREAAAAVKSWPVIKGLAYFDSNKTRSSGCDWRVETSESSWEAFKAMALDPYFDVLGAG